MNKLSLFSGIGGIDLAAEWAGMKTVAFCEREPFPQKVLRKHWPDVPIYDDVCELTAERLKEDGIIGAGRTIDIISAGYPCQPFSVAGNRAGKEDDRHLWPEVARLLREIRPRWFVGENVAGHITLGLDDVLAELESIGYTAQAFVIPSAAVGAPHRRDRVFVLGYTEHNGSHGTEVGRCVNQTGNNNEKRTNASGELKRASRSKCNETLAYSTSERFQRKQWEKSERARDGSANCHQFGVRRSFEPGLGGVLDGISSFVDGYKWPAGLGADQYDWEPPRVAVGVKDRVGRLKALGNAVNPVQIYPIMAAIKAIDEQFRGER